MPVKLYHFELSGPSRGALLAARAIGVPIEVEIIDLLKHEQKNESFLKINPQHCVPTIEDDGFVLCESRAIACFLADKYGKNDDWYPKDLQQRAVVNQRLYFDCSTLYVKQTAVTVPILFHGETEIGEDQRKNLNAALGVLNQYLSKSKWTAGDKPTIADCVLYATMSTILAIEWDISEFPEIQRWVEQCASLPGYEECQKGAKIYEKFYFKCLRK